MQWFGELLLKYYQIKDVNYKNKCYKCIEDINSKKTNKIKEIYNILYSDNSTKIESLWEIQNVKELFGENYNPFITNILVLLGYGIHEKNMEKKNYNNVQKKLYKKRVRETLINDIYIKKIRRN